MNSAKEESRAGERPDGFSSTQLLLDPAKSLGRAGRIRHFIRTANRLLVLLGALWGCFAYSQSQWALLIADVILVAIGLCTFALLKNAKLLISIHWLLISMMLISLNDLLRG